MDSTAPTDPQRLRGAATQRVERLLRDRLRRGGVSTSRPDWFYQCEADAPQTFSGGTQVRVRTWRHWSNAQVQFDADTGELLHRQIDRLADPATQSELSRADALSVAATAVAVPPDARLVTFRHEPFAPGRNVARLEWDHLHDGLRVAGDCLQVLMHPESHRIVALTRRRRKVTTNR